MAAEEETTPAELQRLVEVQKAALRERGPPRVRERARRLAVVAPPCTQVRIAQRASALACRLHHRLHGSLAYIPLSLSSWAAGYGAGGWPGCGHAGGTGGAARGRTRAGEGQAREA